MDYWHDLDRRKAFPQECWQAICDAGLAGAAYRRSMAVRAWACWTWPDRRELSAGGGGATLGQLFMINPIFGGVPISNSAAKPQMKRELLPALVSGKIISAWR